MYYPCLEQRSSFQSIATMRWQLAFRPQESSSLSELPWLHCEQTVEGAESTASYLSMTNCQAENCRPQVDGSWITFKSMGRVPNCDGS